MALLQDLNPIRIKFHASQRFKLAPFSLPGECLNQQHIPKKVWCYSCDLRVNQIKKELKQKPKIGNSPFTLHETIFSLRFFFVRCPRGVPISTNEIYECVHIANEEKFRKTVTSDEEKFVQCEHKCHVRSFAL
jgi:hypothetical protein